MNRRKFLEMISMAGVGTPFLLNGMPSRFMNQFMDFNFSCDAVNERVLVILRLAGANDGLNTVIPVNQYDNYANLRPNIKIAQTGTGAYIPLDTTVALTKQVGLHPSMTGFKSLYDSGKLTLLNGVGYPNPNYSHFRSENLMFAGKDGSNNQDLLDGVFGRYLGNLYPGLSGNPTTQNPDPLAIQLGNLNPCLFYEHVTEKNIEYNLSGFQNTLFGGLQNLIIPQQSEYNDLLDYIKGVATSMDTYYNRVMAVFNAGNNSTTSYPTSTLAKQLKTVARLIKGGSKTKIFQVNLGGFDTHVNQIQSGSTQLGNHANLLADISNSISAFQADIEALGIGHKIMTITFSEFGRQVRENSSLGTDHGDIAPFFVVGNNLSGGIMGDHPLFTNTTSYYYSQAQRKFDYRQIFASLLQDWLGADSGLISSTELQDFVTPTNKINIVSSSSVASAVCTTLGTAEVATKNKMMVYPNPAKDYIHIDFPNEMLGNEAYIYFYDASGRQVLTEKESVNNHRTNVFIGNLPNGNYIIKVKVKEDEFSTKVIIAK